jgi:hypothetical protein
MAVTWRVDSAVTRHKFVSVSLMRSHLTFPPFCHSLLKSLLLECRIRESTCNDQSICVFAVFTDVNCICAFHHHLNQNYYYYCCYYLHLSSFEWYNCWWIAKDLEGCSLQMASVSPAGHLFVATCRYTCYEHLLHHKTSNTFFLLRINNSILHNHRCENLKSHNIILNSLITINSSI